MGVDIYWYAVDYSAVKAAEKTLMREIQSHAGASFAELQEISRRFSVQSHVFEDMWPRAFGYVEVYFPLWSFAHSGRKDHDLRGKHAAITPLQRSLWHHNRLTFLSPREVHYRSSVFAMWRSRPNLRGVSRRTDRFLNDVNRFLNAERYYWEDDIQRHLEQEIEIRRSRGLRVGARTHTLPSKGTAEDHTRCHDIWSRYPKLELGRDYATFVRGGVSLLVEDFSIEELISFEKSSGWELNDVVRLKMQGRTLSHAYTDQVFREFTRGRLCEDLARDFQRAGAQNLAMVFCYSD